jgi:glycerol-3-phosphate dehydrogenase
LAPSRVGVLLDRYGTSARAYAAGADAAAQRPLRSLPSYTVGEITRIATEEYVEHLADLICRRSLIALLGQAGEEVLSELAQILAGALGWDAARTREEVDRALGEVRVPSSPAAP